MRKFLRRGATLAALALALAPQLAAALELDANGWWRSRYFYVDNAPLDPSGRSSDTEFLDMQMRIYPTLHVTDNVRVKGRLDLLRGVVWGQNEDEPSILAGLSDATSQIDRFGSDVDDFQVEHLYAEVTTPVGLLRVGRMQSNWGLGLLANGGTELEWGPDGNGPEKGDSVDRILFLTDLGVPLGWSEDHWVVAALYDRSVELNILNEGDDVHGTGIATFFTNGTLKPRTRGTLELGTYSLVIAQSEDDALAFLFDAFVHAEYPLGADTSVFVTGEVVFGFGETRRGGLVTEGRRQDFVDTVTDGLAELLPRPIAETLAAEGTDIDFVANLVSEGLQGEGLSPEVADTIAREGASAGFDAARDERLDVDVLGSALRGGIEHDMLKLWGEWTYASGQKGGKNVLPHFLGTVGSTDPRVDAALASQLDDALGSAITGTKAGTYPFDSEFDAALILYEEVGPINPVTLTPLVTNTWYLKAVAEFAVTDQTRLWVSGLYGELVAPIETYTIEVPVDPEAPAEAVPAGRADELGFELDWGVDHRFNENLRAEIKMGYLFAGDAFGPNGSDIFMVRPQLALSF